MSGTKDSGIASSFGGLILRLVNVFTLGHNGALGVGRREHVYIRTEKNERVNDMVKSNEDAQATMKSLA